MKRTFFVLLTLGSLLLFQCGNNGYSFRGISIPADVTSYNVEVFKASAVNAPPNLPIETTEKLKEKIRRESRLVLNETDPDISFKGSVVDFRVTAEAPQPGATSAINRLTIVTAVEFINHNNEKEGFKKNFSFFYDFPASTDLSSIQATAVEEILNQIAEDIFNAAFTNW